ncbi:uncharacterized protein LOC132062423 [Lycium ferocissimum]|uniref:uncharacterized protein LOC132062423 n=1 Tax=Lycium ferocissimum TaxID=112874 RepID=UPI0028155564|nr:uncharacterized protein LOC132062423 [Lycium ferocissimum]
MENVLLTQIVRDIKKRTKTANVVVKLDMAKAYDRVSWLFLTKVLRKFGFSEVLIDMVFRLRSNNWYSVLLNRQVHGFFKSSKGVKQGDPLSSTLFILAAEALSRGLITSYKKPSKLSIKYRNLFLKVRPQVRQLFIGPSVVICSLRIIEATAAALPLSNAASQQPTTLKVQQQPVSNSTKVLQLFASLCSNDSASKHNNILAQGACVARETTVIWRKSNTNSHVLQSMPVYLLSGMNPPKGVIRQMHSIFSRFFWSNSGDKKGVRWVKWETLALPKDEGGLGFRSLFEVSNAFFCKLWWNLKTKLSFQSFFMINKYCKKLHPVIAQAKMASPIWRKLVMVRELVVHQIWWQVKKGDSSF